MISTKEGLLTTIRALLEMTETRGCTKAEAAVARGKALNLMRKYGVSVEDLAQRSPFVPPPQAVPVKTARQETDPGRRAAYDYWSTHGVYSEEFVKEVFSRRRYDGALNRIARIIAGYGIAGLAVWTIAAISQGQFTSPAVGPAPPTATQTQSADYVSSPSSAQPQAPAASSARLLKPLFRVCISSVWGAGGSRSQWDRTVKSSEPQFPLILPGPKSLSGRIKTF